MANLTVQTDERGVTTVSLNRIDAYNALNRVMIDEVTATVQQLNSNTRILVLKGNGKHFCAGADIHWMKASKELSLAENHQDALAFSNMLEALNTIHCPTIARVHGAALGGGTGIACCCDMVVAEESAKFAFSEVKLGIIPATISPYALGAIGARAARRYFLTGEQFDALEAYRLGIIHDICSTDNLDYRVEALISNLLNASPQAQQAAKTLIADVAGKTIDSNLRHSLADRLATIRTTAEAQEGLAAFIEKRPASWKEQ